MDRVFNGRCQYPRSPGLVTVSNKGSVAEWFNAAVLKTAGRDERSVGSNPTTSSQTDKYPKRGHSEFFSNVGL